MENIKIFACKSAENFTKEICDYLNLPVGEMDILKFKNDNTFVQIKETVREQDVYIVQTTTPPVNERVMELLIVIDAFKRASAKNINVVLPYYIYSRSDKKDQPRIPVTAKLMQQLLEAAGATRVITCDLHNPAIQAYFNINCDRLSAQNILQKYFKEKNLKDMVIVATDAGSSKKAYKYSEYFGCPIALIDKRREGNDDRAIATTVIGEVENKEDGKYIQKERYSGECARSFYIGEDIKQEDIKASFKNGMLTLTFPKTKQEKNEKKYIDIE